jgi:hypothetical protein
MEHGVIDAKPLIHQALDLYQTTFRKASFTIYCLDFSPSMRGAGQEQLQQAMRTVLDQDEAARYLLQGSPGELTVVIPFAGRTLNDGPLGLIAAKMKPGGEFRLATDDLTYLNWSLMVMQRHIDDFEWVVKEPGEWLRYPSGWLETRYAAKARRQGRVPHQFRYRRTGSSRSSLPSSSSK